jgi:Flp pilus assembly protein TadB
VTRVIDVAAAGPSDVSLAWVPAWATIVVGVMLFAAIVIAVLAIAWPRSVRHGRIKQIANFGPGRVTATTPKVQPEGSAGGAIARTALAATASVVRSGQMESRITHRLERAGMYLRAPEWVLLRTCIAVAGGAAFVALGGGVIGGIIGTVLGWLGTQLYQTIRIDRRNSAFVDQLPDGLQLVIGSLRSGFSLSQALDALVREAPQPVGAEFGRALAEHRLGADVSEALERLAQRTESEDLGWAVMAVRIQRDVGGNLAEVLQTTVDTMRERARLRRHVLSLSAEGRVSAWVLIALPIALSAFMLLYRRDYLAPLVESPVGITLLAGGGLLFVIGIFWIIRVVKVDA